MRNIIVLLMAAGAGAQTTLDKHLSALAESSLAARTTETSALTRVQAEERRAAVRSKIIAEIGGLPETKTPLNARITGGFARQGYRVENLIFESMPRLYVTANVYVPTEGQPPFPAVIGVAGHSTNGKASSTYQHVWISLARRGYVVLAFDPPGQGERLEMLDPATGLSRVGIGTGEHSHNNAQLLLTGSHFARYESWDGVRAFDYLLTRKDVDGARIAVAGNSGGGTQAAYLSVLEPRLAAIVSSCYMTSWKELWYKPGPQDGEQVFPNFLRDQLDFPDFAFAAAPKPFLMTTAIRDYFPIDGARRTHGEIRGFYKLFDAEAKAGYFEYDDPHGWSQPRREAAYRFLDQWLKGVSSDGAEAPHETEPEQLLYATPTGQVHSSLGGETTQSLNAEVARRLSNGRPRTLDRTKVLERLAFHSTEQRFYAAKMTVNPGERHPAVIALNATNDEQAAMRAAGFAVLSIDLKSTPQTASRALLVGRTLLGLQLSDVLHAHRDLTTNPLIDPRHIRIYGRGNGAVVALHAAWLAPHIESVALEAMPVSWFAITQAKLHRGLIDIIVPGVLKEYDLPDLAAAFAPRPLWLVDTRDPAGTPMLLPEVQKVYPPARIAYHPEGWSFEQVFRDWLRH